MIAVTPSHAEITAGTSVSFDVDVSLPVEGFTNVTGGSVALFDGGVPIPGLESLYYVNEPITTPPVVLTGSGVHAITAEYTPSESFALIESGSTGSTNVTVQAASTELVVHSDGTSIVATVTTGESGVTPDGAVRFVVDGFARGEPVPLASGAAVFSDPGLEPGLHDVQARYLPAPGGDLRGESALVTHRVIQPTSVLIGIGAASDGTTVARGQVLPAAPGGTLGFWVDGTVVDACAAVPVEQSNAECDVGDLPAGAHTIMVEYSGIDSHGRSSAEVVTTVADDDGATPGPGDEDGGSAPGEDDSGSAPGEDDTTAGSVAPSAQSIPSTGVDITWPAVFGALLVLGGLALWLSGRGRSRRNARR